MQKKENKKTSREHCKEYEKMAFCTKENSYIHPTLWEAELEDINRQIDTLEEQLRIKANVDLDDLRIRGRYEEMEEICASEALITIDMSHAYEERSRIEERLGRYEDALESLVSGSEHLFDRHCWNLNSLMGKGHPLSLRLYELVEQCRELCRRHPELWEGFKWNKTIKYLLENQHRWPCG